MSVLGFDIGNENSYVAIVKDGGIEIIENEYSLRSTPTYIAFTEKSRDIGIAAKSKVITNLENTMFGFKRILGRKYKDSVTEKEMSYLPHKECELPTGYVGFKVNYLKESTVFTVNQLMAMMLTKLKLLSEIKLSKKVRDCVIAVPANYMDAQRRAMLEAAYIADLNTLKLMNESTAVALLYGFYKQDLREDQPQNVIFVDLGHASLTVTACAFTKEKLQILGRVWDDVGGRDFDNKLVQYFVADFKDRYKLDVMSSKKAIVTLMNECESLKKLMSANSLELVMQIECFMQDMDVKGRMKRELFENLSAGILDRIEEALHKILEKTQFKLSDIHSVEIVGGSCRIPAIKSLIRKVFGREPNSTLNQDEAVARGCALQCALLSPSLKTRNFVIDDIHSHVIKISWKNLESKTEEIELFSATDKIPAFKMITLCMSKPFSLDIYYDSDAPLEMRRIGTFTFGNIPPGVPEEFVKVKIKACLDIHGIFSIVSVKLFSKDVSNRSDEIAAQENGNESKNETLDDISKGFEDHNTKSNPVLYELSIISDVCSLPNEALREFIDKEKQMISKDITGKQQADARNALEEYIYDTRGKLSYELNDFVEENEKNYLLMELDDVENWLYENEDEEAYEYSNKLNDLKQSFEPAFKRYEEWKQRPTVVNDYLQILQQAFDIIDRTSNNGEKINIQDDVENLRKMYQKSKDYLDQSLDACSKHKKYENVPVTVNEMRNSLENFKNNFHKSYQEIKDKITRESTSSGDGKSTQEEKSTKEQKKEDPKDDLSADEVIHMSQE